jgi:protein gp37
MAETTHIEWTDATWNPITGCSVVSPGCTNCYAMKLAGTRLKHHPSRAGLTKDTKARGGEAEGRTGKKGKPVWNGTVRFNEQWLDQPLRWSRPRMIFVCAHADLFHENVPDEWIDRIFAVMALTPQHTYQVLTKRSARMRDYVNGDWSLRIIDQVSGPAVGWLSTGRNILPNVWLGVSAEDQQRADERIPDLLATPAAIRWVSAEPLLGPIDFTRLDMLRYFRVPDAENPNWPRNTFDALRGRSDIHPIHGAEPNWAMLDWVVVGGESGDRPMHPAWARQIRDQCADAGTAFFFKQWGSHRPLTPAEHGQACGAVLIGDDPHDRDAYMLAVTKKAAGRLLDGVEHNAMPERRT